MTDGRSRVDTLPLIGGHPTVDLVNTVSWRGRPERSVDHLHLSGHGVRWARRTAILTAGEAEHVGLRLRVEGVGEPFVASLRALRELAAIALTTDDGALDPDLEACIVDGFTHAHLVGVGTRRRWEITTIDEHTVRRRLALQLEELLTSAPGRIGVCADTDCQWVFLDTSRARNRRWCSSADCGNRFRVREHQRRHERSSAR